MIADAHNDLLLELVLRRDEPNPFAAPGRSCAGGVTLAGHRMRRRDLTAAADELLVAFRRVFDGDRRRSGREDRSRRGRPDRAPPLDGRRGSAR